MQDWLYDEGEDVQKSVYISKLEELQRLGGPIEARFHESETRPAAIASLADGARALQGIAQSNDPAYAHIPQEEKDQVGTQWENRGVVHRVETRMHVLHCKRKKWENLELCMRVETCMHVLHCKRKTVSPAWQATWQGGCLRHLERKIWLCFACVCIGS